MVLCYNEIIECSILTTVPICHTGAPRLSSVPFLGKMTMSLTLGWYIVFHLLFDFGMKSDNFSVLHVCHQESNTSCCCWSNFDGALTTVSPEGARVLFLPWINLEGVIKSRWSMSTYCDPKHRGKLFNSLLVQANAVSQPNNESFRLP